ncbi:photosystem reaction center subunit H [Paenibacillus albiflavus]|uniref:Photosystem reaction center subunit H n=1 Tax=Paenibacillus albiflavus TaxID=2545760 RepID=A0A4R4EGE8_9BACL|nr:PRC-barrel domain-containing protein [Paenibacillus albiflavus]TCZ77215.1 photosystem reaction center subunit H [Paenibacillus albiflavus]
MLKARHIIGLPIICLQNGKRLGKVFDLLIDQDWQLSGVILSPKGWFSQCQTISSNDFVACGEDAITIENRSFIHKWNEDSTQTTLLEGQHKIKGLPIITVTGNQLGILEDVYFSKQMGNKIKGFEISEGFISDLTEGRKWLALPDSVTRGEEAIIVPARCEEEVTEFFVSKEE